MEATEIIVIRYPMSRPCEPCDQCGLTVTADEIFWCGDGVRYSVEASIRSRGHSDALEMLQHIARNGRAPKAGGGRFSSSPGGEFSVKDLAVAARVEIPTGPIRPGKLYTVMRGMAESVGRHIETLSSITAKLTYQTEGTDKPMHIRAPLVTVASQRRMGTIVVAAEVYVHPVFSEWYEPTPLEEVGAGVLGFAEDDGSE